jgi:DNA-binding HxlR family transcriptional regulator
MLRTKAQEKEICATCPMARTANLVGDTCVLLIVRDLLDGPKRFGELGNSLTGVSTRTLTLKLKMLVEKGIIERHEEKHVKPPKVEYILTPKGKGLHTLAKAMTVYGEKYL